MWDEARRLLTLAWPVVLGQLGLMAMGVVDLLMVGPLGTEATAAVGIGNSLSFGLLVLAQGAAAGLDPRIAQAYGAGDAGRAGTEALRGAVLVLVLCVPIVLVHASAGEILVALRQPATVVPLAAQYCGIMAHGVLPFAAFVLLRQLLQGGGAMHPAMWVVGIGNVVNLAGDWLLVHQLGYGVAGVAWCTVIVRWVMVLALLGLSRELLSAARPTARLFVPGAMGRVAATSLPVALQIGLEVWAFNCASFAAGTISATAAAAHTAALSASAVAFMVPLGFSAAAATRIGNLVGAGRDWRLAGAVAVFLGAFVMTGSASVFLWLPDVIGRAYNTDPGVVALVVLVMPLAAGFQWFDGTQVVAFGVLRGLGDTRIPVLFNVVGYWVIGLPVGVWLAFNGGYGLFGIWLGLALGLCTVAVLSLARLVGFARLGPVVPVLD